MQKKTLIAVFIIVIAGFLTGCTSTPSVPSNNTASFEFHEQPLLAMEMFHDDSKFFIKYKQGEKILYAVCDWPEEMLEQDKAYTSPYAIPNLIPIQSPKVFPWASLPENSKKLTILDADLWRNLRNRLLHRVMPEGQLGLVMDFEDAEYFLFFDEQDVFQSTRLIEKPKNYRIAGNLDFDDFMQHSLAVLEKYLKQHGITQTEFVFNTGDSGLFSLPFVYVNTQNRELIFFRHIPERELQISSIPGVKAGRMVGHILKSHLSNLYVRPVSSLYSLFYVVTDTTVSTVSFDWTIFHSEEPVPPVGNAEPMDLVQWEKELDKITSHPLSIGSISILVDGSAFFKRFIDTLTSARKSIEIQTYIFDDDDYALEIADLLKRRSNEGVDVKVLLDGLGTISATMAQASTLPEEHKPPVSVPLYLQSGSAVKVRQKGNPWFTGDHVKTTIVDDSIAFVGGMNIGREYRYEWHDLMVELNGPVVDIIRKEFHSAWALAGPLGDVGLLFSQMKPDEIHSQQNGYPLRVLLTEPGKQEIYRSQLQAISRARSHIYIQNAYLTDDRILRELIKARRRGVDVRVIMPVETDHGPITRSNVLAANAMFDNGIRVFVYPGFSHVKAAVIDGWVCLGSANYDRLSLRLNRELNIASSAPAVTNQLLEKLFWPDFEVSVELTEQIPSRWADYLVELIGDYLY